MAKKKDEKELYDFIAPYLSFVPKGANLKKFFLLKSDDGGIDMFDEKDLEELEEIFKAELPKEVEKFVEDIKKADDKVKNAVKGALRLLNSVKEKIDSGVMKKLTELAGHGHPAPKADKPKEDEEDSKPEFPFKKTYGEVKADVVKAAGKSREAIEKIFKAHEVEDTPITDDPQVLAIMKENEETKKLLGEEREIRINKEFIEKAETYPSLSISKEDFGPVLKDASEGMDKEKFERLEEVLKSAEEVAKASEIFKQKGTDLGGGGDAMVKIEKAADKLMEDDKELTKEAAIAKVAEKNPELYEEYEKTRGA